MDTAVLSRHLRLLNNAYCAMSLTDDGVALSSSDWQISDPIGVPLFANAWGLVTLPENIIFSGNTVSRIAVRNADFFSRSGTIPAQSIPSYLRGHMQISGATTITVAPGAQSLMGTDARLTLSWNRNASEVHIGVTAENPVTFDYTTGLRGGWEHLHLPNAVSAEWTFSQVVPKNGGGDGEGLFSTNRTTALLVDQFINMAFEESTTSCLYIQRDTSLDYSGNGNTFTNCDSSNIVNS